MRRLSVAAVLPGTSIFLIEAASYECGHYELVNRLTGRVLEISTIPEISPGGKYIVSTDDSDACARTYDIAIWSTRTDPPTMEMMYGAGQYENWKVTGWEGDDHFRLKGFINSREGPYDQEAEAVRSAGGWELVLGRRTDRVEQKPETKHAVPTPPKRDTPPWPNAGISPWPTDAPTAGAVQPK